MPDLLTIAAVLMIAAAIGFYGTEDEGGDAAGPPPPGAAANQTITPLPSTDPAAPGVRQVARASPPDACDTAPSPPLAIPADLVPTEEDLCPLVGPFAATETGQTVFDWTARQATAGATSAAATSAADPDVPLTNLHRANVVIALDVSGSMAGWRIAEAKAAVRHLVRNAPPATNLALVAFGLHRWRGERLPNRAAQTRLLVPLGTGNRLELLSAIDALQAMGGTPTSVAVATAARALHAQFLRQRRYGYYDLIVVTDGRPNDGFEPDTEIRRLHRGSPVTVHTVAFSTDIPELRRLRDEQVMRYHRADDQARLVAVFEEILAEY